MSNDDNSLSRPQRQHAMLIFIGLLAINFIIAGISGAVTANSVDTWYRTLTKPNFNPPDNVFGPVWTTLYALIAYAAWRVWRTHHPRRAVALRCYGLQLLLNFFWSMAFFGLHNPLLALIDLIALEAIAAACLIYFARIDRIAALLWLPYLMWLSFALLLNAAIVVMN